MRLMCRVNVMQDMVKHFREFKNDCIKLTDIEMQERTSKRFE